MIFKKIMPQNKKGAGLIMGLVMGIAALVIAVIIAFVIVSTVATIESDTSSLIGSKVINESGHMNDTGYTVAAAGITGFANPVINVITNISNSADIPTTNATISSAGVITNSSSNSEDAVYFSYTYDYKATTVSTENLRANFTAGIDEVSDKIPTVLLIAAVVLILGVLILLWTQYKRMDIGGGGGEL